MNKVLKCINCKYHTKKLITTHYYLNFCLKFNTFQTIAKNNDNLCGPEYKKFVKMDNKPFNNKS
jgi:hypothetical protein